MKILVTGATGFVGSALISRLRRRKDTVRVVSRSAVTATAALGQDVDVVQLDAPPTTLLAGIDGVINLMGEPIIGRRWTGAQKTRLRNSRVDGTRNLVAAMRALEPAARPKTLISASAIGFYGPRGEQELAEDALGGNDFLAEVCSAWENAALSAAELGVRVVVLRFGVVLGADGGALARMLPPFRLGLGGPIGNGRQYMSWIHRDDLVAMITHVLDTPTTSGAFNATAPTPVTNREFTRVLARTLHRPAFFPVPPIALTLAFGEAASLLTDGQRILPRRALASGFQFRFPTLAPALADLLPRG